jgi:urease beta subunit
VTPGELLLGPDDITLNAGRPAVEITVQNCSRHVIFVSSHYPFFEVNRRLVFDRASAFGMHLDLPAGDAVSWEPGEVKKIQLVPYAGRRVIRGFHGLTAGVAEAWRLEEAMRRVAELGFGQRPERAAGNGT